MALLLTQALFDDFFLLLYHSSISCIRQQSLTSIGFLGKKGEEGGASSRYLLR